MILQMIKCQFSCLCVIQISETIVRAISNILISVIKITTVYTDRKKFFKNFEGIHAQKVLHVYGIIFGSQRK